jgi:hypothetical protein
MYFNEVNEEECNLVDLGNSFTRDELCLGVLLSLAVLGYFIGVLVLCIHLFTI